MTDKELAAAVEAALKQTTVSYPSWVKKVAAGQYPDVSATQWGKAFDGLSKIGVAVEPPPPPPPPPSTGALPFAEASLRTGYLTLTTADIPVGVSSYTLPTSSDYLIDLGWVKRDRALKIYTRSGQRVHTKNVYIEVSIAATASNAYSRSGFGYRPASASAPPADHLSLTGCLITGATLADGLTFGDSQSTAVNANKVTYQRCRVESRSRVLGRQVVAPADEGGDTTPEHYDAFQMQGPLGIMEWGLCTIYLCNFGGTNGHPGKGMMLNGYAANSSSYQMVLDKVNFQDDKGATGCGDVWIKDDNRTRLTLRDVFMLHQRASYDVWPTSPGPTRSDLFLNTATQGGANQGWTSSGSAPNRVASFPAVSSVVGTVQEGLPSGVDYVTRAALGL